MGKSGTKNRNDEIVRRYLTALNDPASLVDEAEVADIRTSLDETEDPVERLRLRAALAKAENPPMDEVRNEFVAVAKEYAQEHGLDAGAFRAEGVPMADLRAAGLVTSRRSGRRSSGNGARSPRVSRETVRDYVLNMSGTIDPADVIEALGASRTTVRTVIKSLVDDGTLVEAGTSDRSGPGRRSAVYQRA